MKAKVAVGGKGGNQGDIEGEVKAGGVNKSVHEEVNGDVHKGVEHNKETITETGVRKSERKRARSARRDKSKSSSLSSSGQALPESKFGRLKRKATQFYTKDPVFFILSSMVGIALFLIIIFYLIKDKTSQVLPANNQSSNNGSYVSIYDYKAPPIQINEVVPGAQSQSNTPSTFTSSDLAGAGFKKVAKINAPSFGSVRLGGSVSEQVLAASGWQSQAFNGGFVALSQQVLPNQSAVSVSAGSSFASSNNGGKGVTQIDVAALSKQSVKGLLEFLEATAGLKVADYRCMIVQRVVEERMQDTSHCTAALVDGDVSLEVHLWPQLQQASASYKYLK